MSAQPILLVEDDPEIRDLLTALLEREGHAVVAVGDAPAFDAARAATPPRLVVLDVMLPGEDGFSICRRLRAEGDTPILMLTARGDDIDRIVGLEIGADDYLPKPFNPREFIARVRALLRRAAATRAPAQPSRETIRIAGITVDLGRREVFDASDAVVPLTSGEFDLLAALCEGAGRVLSRDTLLDRVFGRESAPYDRSIDVLISRLRRKLQAASVEPGLIKTIRNAGYMLAVGPDRR